VSALQNMSRAELATASTTADRRVGERLTESILTLRQTIRNVKEDVANNIAPSILLPMDPVNSASKSFKIYLS
jgi:hypothetical protein